MKIWFNFYRKYQEDVKVGINWYVHKSKDWKGFTGTIMFFKWSLDLNIIWSGYDDYDRIVVKREPYKNYIKKLEDYANKRKKTS